MTKVIFFGTPEYVIPIPEALKKSGHEIVAVITQPPKPVGRKKELTPSPIAQWAEKYKVPVLANFRDLIRKSSTPRTSTVSSVEPSLRLEEGSPCEAEIGVLAAYGRIIPKEVMELFPHGILNIHPSLLPKYRGASPVQAAIIAGDKQTGVTIIKLDKEVDHGPIVHQFKEPIREDDTTGTLRERLFKKAAGVLPETLDNYLNGKITPKEQEHRKATFTTLIKKSDGFIETRDVVMALDGRAHVRQLERFIRAMQPWPGTYTNIKLTRYQGSKITRINKFVIRMIKILSAHIKDGRLILDQVQLEGKNPVPWKQFTEGYPEAKFN